MTLDCGTGARKAPATRLWEATAVLAVVVAAGALGLLGSEAPGQQVGLCGDGLLCNIPGCTSGPNGGLEQCDQGVNNSDSAPDACRRNCALPRCGDGVVDRGEVCDDGNTSGADACPADCRLCQDRDQQACINTINKRGAKVAAAQAKENLSCASGATKGKLTTTIDECLALDAKGKVGSAQQKTLSDEALKCPSGRQPGFGYTSGAAVNEAAVEEERGLMNDIFGEEIDGVISPTSAGSCQTAVVKSADKILATKMQEFLRCKKSGLKDQTMCSGTDLEGCLDVLRADNFGKIAKAVDRLQSDFSAECRGIDVAAAFPGLCRGAADFPGCVDALVECRTCQLINRMDGVDGNCDLFDDGMANGTCGGTPPTPTPTPLPTFTATSTATPTKTCGSSPLLIEVGPDPIRLQYGSNTSVTARATPLTGQYRNWIVKNSSFDVTPEFLQQPNCPNQPDCTALISAPEVKLPAPSVPYKVCGTAEAEVSFRCSSNGQDATDTAIVEVGCGNKSAAECISFCAQESVQGQCGTPCGLTGVTPPAYNATTGSCWKTNVNGTDYCYWDYKSTNSPGLGNLCCPNRCYGGSFVVWGQGFGVYNCTVIERCADNPAFAGSECVDVTGT